MAEVKGFKVFKPDWTCRGFRYTCPGTFEEDVKPSVCDRGFHFCVNAADCFKYCSFNPNNKVAEVIALGEVDSDDTKSCTNKIQIVREIPWSEMLEIVNTGKGCAGLCNSGDWNSGDWNSGDWNSGNRNSGNRNSGYCNSGDWNSGDWNSGDRNIGDWNSGNRNIGNRNIGDWNKTSFSAGCFCTEEPKILLFNKPSCWTMRDWINSEARYILSDMPMSDEMLKYVDFSNMTEQEKADHPEAETTGGYLNVLDKPESGQKWWNSLSKYNKSVVKSIPNFDKAIFKEITGIEI